MIPLDANDYVGVLNTKTRIYLSMVPKDRRREEKYEKELSDLLNLLSQDAYLDLFSVHETGHVVYFEKAGVTDFTYIPPLIKYEPPSTENKEDFNGQWAGILPKNYVEPPDPRVDIEGLNDWLFLHAKAFAAGGVFSRNLTTTDYGGDTDDHRRFRQLCDAAYEANKLIGVECMWLEAQKQVENELRDDGLMEAVKARMHSIKRALYFSHLV